VRFLARYPWLRADLRSFSRRRQGLKNGKDGPELPADPEGVQEDFLDDERKSEVVEPQPEPVPSARDEFHQAYTEKLQAADKDVEEYSRTLDSVSYPVGARFPLSPSTKPLRRFVSARVCYLRQSSYFSSIAKPNLAQRVCPCTGLT
jgi:hypothetical protein